MRPHKFATERPQGKPQPVRFRFSKISLKSLSNRLLRIVNFGLTTVPRNNNWVRYENGATSNLVQPHVFTVNLFSPATQSSSKQAIYQEGIADLRQGAEVVMGVHGVLKPGLLRGTNRTDQNLVKAHNVSLP